MGAFGKLQEESKSVASEKPDSEGNNSSVAEKESKAGVELEHSRVNNTCTSV